MVILKGLNDAFGGGNLQWLPLLLTLDSVHLSTQYPFHQDVAQNIADNVLSMAKGTIAPPFELPDTAGEIHSLKNLKINTLIFNLQIPKLILVSWNLL